MRIRIGDGKNLDPGWKKFGSGINNPDPQHWARGLGEKRRKLPSYFIMHEQIFVANEKGHRILGSSVADPACLSPIRIFPIPDPDPHQRI
jgi:hypothetical protein